MDGFKARRVMLDDHENIVKPLIIALTAKAGEEDRKRSEEAGMIDFLPKAVKGG